MNADVYTVAAYDAHGEETRRWAVYATHPAEACMIAERQVAEGLIDGVTDAAEYQAVLRHLSDEEIIAERYEARAEAFVCDTCGEAHTVAYATDGDFGAQRCCLACVYSGLAHGRHHVAEAFVEELLPACGYCGTSGHLASDCPERDSFTCPECEAEVEADDWDTEYRRCVTCAARQRLAERTRGEN